MKVKCLCGNLVPFSGSEKMRWTKEAEWWEFIDLIDAEIEQMSDLKRAEATIMKIRNSVPRSGSVAECGECHRLISVSREKVVFLRVEAVIEDPSR